MPVTIFTGPSEQLPEIFVLLNQQGIKLTRYEIYAAQWLDHRYTIENTAIIESIWDKYKTLEDKAFSLDVVEEAPDEQSRRERSYTLFEYLFGLGQYLAHRYPQFFKPVAVDKPSPIGFNLMSACIGPGIAEKHVRELPEAIRGLDLSTLETYILEATDFVGSLLQPVLSAQRAGQSKRPYFHSEAQILSLIASAFRARYSEKDLSELSGWQAKRTKLAKHIPMYYLYDILQENWRGSGDSKLANYVSSERYLKPVATEETWRQALDVWFRNNMDAREHAKKYVKDEYPEYLLLRYIYAKELLYARAYQVLHIVPIARLLSPPSYYSAYYGPINSIGNLALVDAADPSDYGDQAFAEHLKRRRSGSQFRRHEERLICQADMLPDELTQQKFEQFLFDRFELLKTDFIKAWRHQIPHETGKRI